MRILVSFFIGIPDTYYFFFLMVAVDVIAIKLMIALLSSLWWEYPSVFFLSIGLLQAAASAISDIFSWDILTLSFQSLSGDHLGDNEIGLDVQAWGYDWRGPLVFLKCIKCQRVADI